MAEGRGVIVGEYDCVAVGVYVELEVYVVTSDGIDVGVDVATDDVVGVDAVGVDSVGVDVSASVAVSVVIIVGVNIGVVVVQTFSQAVVGVAVPFKE